MSFLNLKNIYLQQHHLPPPLSPTPVHRQPTSATEPLHTLFALHSTLLLTHWPSPLCSTLVTCLVTFSPEPPPTHTTQHVLLSSRLSSLLSCLVLCQVLTPGTPPLPSVLCHIIPVFTNLHSLQVLLHQVPPPSS